MAVGASNASAQLSDSLRIMAVGASIVMHQSQTRCQLRSLPPQLSSFRLLKNRDFGGL